MDYTQASLDALMSADLTTLSYVELTALNTEIANRKDALKDRLREVARHLDQRGLEREVLARYEEMSDDQKRVLRQVVGVEATPSGETFGPEGGTGRP